MTVNSEHMQVIQSKSKLNTVPWVDLPKESVDGPGVGQGRDVGQAVVQLQEGKHLGTG